MTVARALSPTHAPRTAPTTRESVAIDVERAQTQVALGALEQAELRPGHRERDEGEGDHGKAEQPGEVQRPAEQGREHQGEGRSQAADEQDSPGPGLRVARLSTMAIPWHGATAAPRRISMIESGCVANWSRAGHQGLAMQADLLIRGAQVFDGTGAPGSQVDVAARQGVILKVGDCSDLQATRVVDASAMVVAPGFIDIHTHSDMSLMLDGRGQSKVSQGVTTEVTGNCGFSPFPINPGHMQLHLDLLAGIGDDALPMDWTDLQGYREAIEARGIAPNIAPLVGHGALRIAAMGLRTGAASASEMAAMLSLLDTQLDQGAFGLTTGLTYVPSRYAPTEELVSLCETLARRKRLYASHARDKDLSGDDHRYGPLNEALHLGRSTGARIQYSHAAINTPSEWGTAGLWTARFDTAVAQGVDAAFDVYPYDASSSALTQYLPAWVQEGGVAAMRERLSDEATMDACRGRSGTGLVGQPHRLAVGPRGAGAHRRCAGRRRRQDHRGRSCRGRHDTGPVHAGLVPRRWQPHHGGAVLPDRRGHADLSALCTLGDGLGRLGDLLRPGQPATTSAQLRCHRAGAGPFRA